jgi:hypothetical protein
METKNREKRKKPFAYIRQVVGIAHELLWLNALVGWSICQWCRRTTHEMRRVPRVPEC